MSFLFFVSALPLSFTLCLLFGLNLRIRYVQALMLSIAMGLAYSLRINLSIAIVAMTDKTQKDSFDWSTKTQSVVLSSFFWGYVILQIPAGILVAKYGGKLLLLICMTANCVLTCLIPAASHLGGWKLLCTIRVMQGFFQGLLFPSTHNLLGKWAPVAEKSRIGTIVYSGSALGFAIQNLVSGVIADAWGWPSIFYISGAFTGLWAVAYFKIGASAPSKAKYITQEEVDYIENSLHQHNARKLKTPWKSIATSCPFLSLIITHMGHNLGYFTLMSEIPTYYAKILYMDIEKNGLMSALPYTAIFIFSLLFGVIADYVVKRKIFSITVTRKIFNSIGLYGPALGLIGLSFAPTSNPTLCVVLIIYLVGINAGQMAGLMLVHIDMAPNFAGQLMGITNFFANLMSIVGPLIAGQIIENGHEIKEWKQLFLILAGVYVIANSVFVIFGSAKTQKWNESTEIEDPAQKKKSEANESNN